MRSCSQRSGGRSSNSGGGARGRQRDPLYRDQCGGPRTARFSNAEFLRMTVMDATPLPRTQAGRRLWQEFIAHGVQRGDNELRRNDGTMLRERYWAYASVAPGVHISLLIPPETWKVKARCERAGMSARRGAAISWNAARPWPRPFTTADRTCYSGNSFLRAARPCLPQCDAGWSSPVARWAHNPKVGGSNPPPATTISPLDS
jgi:hypothetical protein